MHNISLTVFFPCYNEEDNIAGLVHEAIRVLNNLVRKYEILIINDGSTDNTGPIADSLSTEHKNVRVIHHPVNRGYGGALISGFADAAYDWIFFTDGDNQFYMQEIELLLNEINNYDTIVGFRKLRRDPWHRTIYAKTWNLLVRIFLGLKIKDLNCAFKLIKKNALAGDDFHSTGALISAELLLKLKLSGASIREVGVSHKPRIFGKQTGGSPKVILKALTELIKLHKKYRASL